jgi:hypothetical protein
MAGHARFIQGSINPSGGVIWQARPMNWNDSLSGVGPVFVQGLFLSLGLIVAIGAQNAFVLRQGLRRF